MNSLLFPRKMLPMLFAPSICLSMAFLFSTNSFGQTLLYQSDFNKGIDGRSDASGVSISWSTNVTVPPDGAPLATCFAPGLGKYFFGRFGKQTVTLNLSNLPAHDSLIISFAFYANGSWDGNSPIDGPDRWGFAIDDSDTLSYSTFANMYNAWGQSYPQRYDPNHIINNPMKTGAELSNVLGISYFGDAVYHFSFEIPNNESSVNLNFISNNVWTTGEDITTDETWGIDSIIVSIPSCSIPLAEQSATVRQEGCQPVNTFVRLEPCGTVILDSLWLTGSQAFSIDDSRSAPRALLPQDSIALSYRSLSGPDTAELNLRYNNGMGMRDTSIQVIGSLASPLLAQPERLHRESGSAFVGAVDTLPLAVDMGTNINLDSLWPYLTEVSATYNWDSSIVGYEGYLPPSGWIANSLMNHGNSVDIDLQKQSASASNPLSLGIALFWPKTTQLATTWVRLPIFTLHIDSEFLPLCTTDNEDSHWSVKTLGAPSGVSAANTGQHGIAIYPNPVGNELFLHNPAAETGTVAIYDAMGRRVARATVQAGSLDVHTLIPGVYFVRIVSQGTTQEWSIVKR